MPKSKSRSRQPNKRKKPQSFENLSHSSKRQKQVLETENVSIVGNKQWSSPNAAIEWLLKCDSVASLSDFFDNYWGRKPLLISRNDSSYYNRVNFTLQKLKDIVTESGNLRFDTNLICKKYDSEGKKEIEPDSKVLTSDGSHSVTVKKLNTLFHKLKNTVQFHHPQHFVESIAHLIYLLESYFGVLVGCNSYLTPPNTQGLAAHWDDIEVFVLQTEGSKHWYLYERTDVDETNPMECSDTLNLAVDALDAKLIMECTLHPGDLLYFPRGTIHFAKSVGDTNSTHLTISTHQQTTWGHWFSRSLSTAVDEAMDSIPEIRQNLPGNFLSALQSNGAHNSDDRSRFISIQNEMIDRLKKSMEITASETADEVAVDFLARRLPPPASTAIHNDELKMADLDLTPKSKVKLIALDLLRLVSAETHSELISEAIKYATEAVAVEKEITPMMDDSEPMEIESGIVRLAPMESTKVDSAMADFMESSDNDNGGEDVKESDSTDDDDKSRESDSSEEDLPDWLLFYSTANDASTHMVQYLNDPMPPFIPIAMPMNNVIMALIQNGVDKYISISQLWQSAKQMNKGRLFVTKMDVAEFVELLIRIGLVAMKDEF